MKPLLLGGVGLVKCRVKAGPALVRVVAKLGPVLESIRWLEDAPFKTVHLILRFGEAKPTTFFEPILKEHSELPIARELSSMECQTASRTGTLETVFMRETLIALRDVAAKYSLSSGWLAQQAVQADGPASGGSAV